MIDDRKRLFARGALLSGLETPPVQISNPSLCFLQELTGKRSGERREYQSRCISGPSSWLL